MTNFYQFASKHPLLASLFVVVAARATVKVAHVVANAFNKN